MNSMYDNLKVPKYVQLKELIKKQIEEGNLPPDSKLRSYTDLVKEYGTSEITVRKAISDLIVEGYVYAVQGKGTFVAARKAKHLTIALIMPHLYSSNDAGYVHDASHITPLIRYAEDETRNNDGNIILYLDEDNPEKERENLQNALNRLVDGIILMPLGGQRNIDCIQRIQDAGIPIVMIDRYLEGIYTHYVTTDNIAGAYQATKHLINTGLEKIYFISGGRTFTSSIDRLKGYKMAMDERGLYSDAFVLHTNAISRGSDIENESYELAGNIARSAYRPFGLFADNNAVMLGAWRRLQDENVDPGKYALACFDRPSPSLFTGKLAVGVEQKQEEIARTSVMIIMESLSGGYEIRRITVMPKLIIASQSVRL